MFGVLVLIGLVEGIISIITVFYACLVLYEPYQTWMTSNHVAIPMTANSEEEALNGNQPTLMVLKNPELKAMEKAHIEMRKISDLGVMQLFLGGIAALLQIILVGMESTPIADWGTGIWCGLVIGIAGGIGLIAHNSPSRKSIEALLVLSIFAGVFAMIMLGFSWIGILHSRRQSNIDGVSSIPDYRSIRIIILQYF